MSQFVSNIKTANFYNKENNHEFDISTGDIIEFINNSGIERESVSHMFTMCDKVVIRCNKDFYGKEYFEVDPAQIITINGIKITNMLPKC